MNRREFITGAIATMAAAAVPASVMALTKKNEFPYGTGPTGSTGDTAPTGSTGPTGRTFYVDGHGWHACDTNAGIDPKRPWKTLGKALSETKEGDVVYLRPGVYEQELIFTGCDNPTINIGNNTCLVERCYFDRTAPSWHSIASAPPSDDVYDIVVKNCTFINGGPNAPQAQALSSA